MDFLKDFQKDEIKEAKRKKQLIVEKIEERKARIEAAFQKQLQALDAEFKEELEESVITVENLLRDKQEQTKAFFLNTLPEEVAITRMGISENALELWFMKEDWMILFKTKKLNRVENEATFEIEGRIFYFKKQMNKWGPNRIYSDFADRIKCLIMQQKEYRLRSVFDEVSIEIHEPRLKDVSLTEFERIVMMLQKKGLSYEEIGQQLGKTKKAIDNVTQRIYHKLFY